jgi:K+-transporting ATPase KdpC subunit
MLRYLTKSVLLIGITVVIVCGVYPAILWVIGQTLFPFQANGSIVRGDDGKVIGSMLVAQPFTKDEYFQPRPSAASYDATASTSSGFAPSNYALRDRVARVIGPIATYAAGDKKGQAVAPDVEAWFKADKFGGNPHIVAQWADAHNGLAQGWVTADPTHGAYVDEWTKGHDSIVKDWIKKNPATPQDTHEFGRYAPSGCLLLLDRACIGAHPLCRSGARDTHPNGGRASSQFAPGGDLSRSENTAYRYTRSGRDPRAVSGDLRHDTNRSGVRHPRAS